MSDSCKTDYDDSKIRKAPMSNVGLSYSIFKGHSSQSNSKGYQNSSSLKSLFDLNLSTEFT